VSPFESTDVSAALRSDVPEGRPTRLPDGRPWVRWAMAGRRGWHALGARGPEPAAGRGSFWGHVVAAAAALRGARLDEVHAAGESILTLGGLGVTLVSGYAQMLLYLCMELQPARFVDVMAPVLHLSGVFPKASARSPSGYALVSHDGHTLLTEAELQSAVMLGGSQTTQGKGRALIWVSCCSELLRDEAMDAAQLRLASRVLPPVLSSAVRTAIRWPTSAVDDAWQYTHERQLLWAVCLVLGAYDGARLERLVLDAASAVDQDDGDAVLRQLGGALEAGGGTGWRTLRRLGESFRVKPYVASPSAGGS